MRHAGKRALISIIVPLLVGFLLVTEAFGFSQATGTPAAGDLATRVAALETRVAVLEGGQGAAVGTPFSSPAASASPVTNTVVTVPPPATPVATPAAVQHLPITMQVPPFEVTITGVTRATTVGEFMTATARGVYVVVNLTLLNTGNEPADYISSAVFQGATLRDDQGRTFSLDHLASISASKDSGTSFQPGLTYQVALAFDVPPDAKAFTLVVDGHEIPLNV